MGNCKGAPSARRDAEDLALKNTAAAAAAQSGEVKPEPQHNFRHDDSQIDVLKKVQEVVNGVGELKGPQGSDVEWLNFAVAEIWPFADKSIQAMIKDTVEPAIQAAVPAVLSSIHFSEFSLGTNPPKLGPVNVCKKDAHSHPGVELEIGVQWECNGNIVLTCAPGLELGLKKLTLNGQVYVILRPLMESIPIVGGIQLTMVAPPEITWEFTGLAQVVQFPSIASTIKGVVNELLSDLLVLPNRKFIHWVWGREREIDISEMQFPRPQAIIRLGVVRARNLHGKDWSFLAKMSSDPYARITVGALAYKTPSRMNTLEPHWENDGWFDYLMYTPKQHVTVELYDEDLKLLGERSDDLLGELIHKDGRKVNLCDVLQPPPGQVEPGSGSDPPGVWWPIYHKSGKDFEPAGEILIKVEAFALKADQHLFSPTEASAKRGKANADGILTVQLRGLRGLPMSMAKGAIIRCTLTGSSAEPVKVDSIRSIFREAVKGLKKEDEIDPAVQRMVEYLSMEKTAPDKIAQVSGLTLDQVEDILEQKPSFHTSWNQGIHLLIGNPDKAHLQLQLLVLGDGKEAAPIELAHALDIKDLLDRPDLRYEDNLTMYRSKRGPAGIIEGPFELDICIQLHGLVKAKLN